MFHRGADQLKAEHREDKKDSHNFAGASLRQPALNPREHGLHQHKVEQGERQDHKQGPGKQRRTLA